MSIYAVVLTTAQIEALKDAVRYSVAAGEPLGDSDALLRALEVPAPQPRPVAPVQEHPLEIPGRANRYHGRDD